MHFRLGILLFAVSVAATAHATTGPAYPAPGGTTYSPSGSLGTGTLIATYSGFDLNATDQLWWGAYMVGVAMDGSINSAGETLTYNAAQSNLAGGVAVYLGSTQVSTTGGPVSVTTRYTVSLSDLSGNAIAFNTNSATLGIAGTVFPLFEVTGGFRATQTLTANGTAYQTYFDTLPNKNGGGGQLVTNIARGFYYTEAVPEPATWALLALGFGMVGAAVRSRRVSVRFG